MCVFYSFTLQLKKLRLSRHKWLVPRHTLVSGRARCVSRENSKH